MGCQRVIVLSAFLLFTKDYEVSAQYATVLECVPQLTATVSRPIVQSGGNFILPAIIQPIVPGYDSYGSDLAACYPNRGQAPGYPPIIIKDDNDMWRNLLFFMILSMGNKKDNYSPPPCYGCPCSYGSRKCKCPYCNDCPYCGKSSSKNSDGGSNSNGNSNSNGSTDSSSSAPIYIPIPIAIPVYTGPDGCRYIDGFCDDILIQESYGQQCTCSLCNGGEPNELNLIIRTD